MIERQLTDKFELWQVAGGESLSLDGAGAVAVVVGGEGAVNGLAVRRGDRLVVSGEQDVACTGTCRLVVCYKPGSAQ